ncbi:PP2C family serine/threonine-protein phosphatase [Sinimarinibacterium sp. NLF-5-8]|uniref:PP2C family protein-serine/threonine phosphatase n=1 Tax=Sinimarinibacterium sp. NLF-5-8 TaxID=2698684 RepID=UPI00137BB7DB|nr:protein phosphatase 2C domain-containing protein [Sinimarinibacterium sp. NLF-5-8]QHS10027.1 serine/threonine-protein phosphatase [Sinimarinibacterium sp. NLF-5-8]
MFRLRRHAGGRSVLKIALAGASHPGKHRDHNEDAYTLLPEHSAAVIADGMGGLARGEVASRMVIDTVSEYLSAGHSADDAIQQAHRRIRDHSIASGSERMGSTAVVLCLSRSDNTAHVYWVGDSRAYLWRGGQLKQISKDHSFVEDLIDAGAISAEEAETHPNRNVLTRAVGVRDTAQIKVDHMTLPLQAGDRILLCTDGLHGYLPHALLLDCLQQYSQPAALVEALVARTLADSEAGDNVTAVCMAAEG